MKQFLLLSAMFIAVSICACNDSGKGSHNTDTTTASGQPGRNPAEDSIPGAGNYITPLDSANPARDTEDKAHSETSVREKDTTAERR